VADLQAQAAADRATAESLVGQWAPQISSKRPGMVVNGVSYDYPGIMADFQALRSRYPKAILLYSGDYANFTGRDFWVTIDADAFATAEQANAWCDQQGFGEQDCYASRLEHTGGPDGNAQLR
jgi:serine/threonine-protein kinase